VVVPPPPPGGFVVVVVRVVFVVVVVDVGGTAAALVGGGASGVVVGVAAGAVVDSKVAIGNGSASFDPPESEKSENMEPTAPQQPSARMIGSAIHSARNLLGGFCNRAVTVADRSELITAPNGRNGWIVTPRGRVPIVPTDRYT
jgi:hypothetical protein